MANQFDGGVCVARSETATEGENNGIGGCLSKGYCVAKAQVFSSAFDLAISSEALKN